MKKKMVLAFSFALVFLLTSCAVKGTSQKNMKPKEIVKPQNISRINDQKISERLLNGLNKFASNSSEFLFSNPDKNELYSPVSLYTSLLFSAYCANGSTRSEILNAISAQDVSSNDACDILSSMNVNDSVGRLNLANSLWIDKKIDIKKDFLQKAAKDYYVDSFSTDFSSKSGLDAINKWISRNTGGKLSQGSDKPLPSQVMEFINTIYFEDQWVDEFDKKKTSKDKFFLADGKSSNCSFMNMTEESRYIKTDGYAASSLPFKNGESMTFILPDEGVSPYDIIKKPDMFLKASNALSSEDGKCDMVTFKVPKFKYNACIKLNDSIEKMGAKKAFGPDADFSNISLSKPLFISDVIQRSMISIDEKGCEAAAYTKIDMAGAAKPDGNADMILNRPFIFEIESPSGVPIFIGIVNTISD